ncbi:MAG TPA: alpha/beta hydrolase [Mycobacteriales bacterium]|nr:alpha/beta hydrolase [Mycobacteriales bacterium]
MSRLSRLARGVALALPLGLAGLVLPSAASSAPATAVGPAVRPAVWPAVPLANGGDGGVLLPAPSGRYPVGSDTLHLVDRSRPDPWVPAAGPRELMVSMFYPARPGPGPRARYATIDEARLLLAAQGLADLVPAATFSGIRTNSRVGARPAPGRFPLVVLSPGLGAPRYTLTSLAEDLASRGYVIAAVDHAYESVGTAFPGGRLLTCVLCAAETEDQLRQGAVGRGRDVSFVLDQLTGRHPAWPYAGLIDRSRIGMAGHSYGGASALSAMAGDRRIRAGANMDGAFHDPVAAAGLGGRPFLLLGTDAVHRPGGTDRSWDDTWPRLAGWKRWLTVAGADHNSFTDFSGLSGQLGLPGPALPGDRAVRITRAYLAAFFDLHLKHIRQPLLAGPTPANPEVRFNNP